MNERQDIGVTLFFSFFFGNKDSPFVMKIFLNNISLQLMKRNTPSPLSSPISSLLFSFYGNPLTLTKWLHICNLTIGRQPTFCSLMVILSIFLSTCSSKKLGVTGVRKNSLGWMRNVPSRV